MIQNKRSILASASAAYLTVLGIVIILSFQNIWEHLRDHKLLYSSSGNYVSVSDFMHFFVCGKVAYSADAHNLYDPLIQRQWLNKSLANLPGASSNTEKTQVANPFYAQATPYFFCLIGLLSQLNPETAFLFWSFVSLIAGLAGLFALSKQSGIQPKYWAAVAIWALAMFPSLAGFRLGQVVWFLLGIECLYFWGFWQKRDICAGLALAMTSLRPQYCLFLLIPPVVQKRWRLLASFACGMATLLVWAGITLGWQTVLNYPLLALYAESSGKHFGVGAQKQMVSLRGLLNLLVPIDISVYLGMAILAGSLLLTTWLWLKANKQDSHDLIWLVSLTTLLALLSSPHTYCYDLSLLALTAMTLPKMFSCASLSTMPGALRLWYAILIFYPLLSWCAPLINILPSAATLLAPAPLSLLTLINIAWLSSGLAYYLAPDKSRTTLGAAEQA